ncbi:hypothetical protein J31TS4_35010 [Paenibacillus sp. J31TS4]|uniref:hypothetical protein n=1 Tax=Paenibacillus sp. J31TS4 TaxID=2807195 RepID=UPI001B2D620F|nr:hypothetical protein [Paenibacillus sp. J31TS4]GIP40221.1 hypothetical protein J31TS4_35010 [Paenibacillus sp. J31TS4]
MSFEFRHCTFEMDYESYISFLLQHHAELNLPYPFALKLSFLSSPLLLGKAMLILSEEPYEIIGAAGFVYGTGANDYKDRQICQVEVAYLLPAYRRTLLFGYALQALLDAMKAGNPDVETVQFWSPQENADLEKLFSKFGSLPGAERSVVNQLVCYRIPYAELQKAGRRPENRHLVQQRS